MWCDLSKELVGVITKKDKSENCFSWGAKVFPTKLQLLALGILLNKGMSGM